MKNRIETINEILVQLQHEVELIKYLAPLVKELRVPPPPRRARVRTPLPPIAEPAPPADPTP